jgi:hypothetical protein
MYPGRTRIELFARGEPREGWKTWGIESMPDTAATIEELPVLEEDEDLRRFQIFGRPAFQNEAPKIYNVWNFNKVDLRLGQLHPGQIPGQIAMNVLMNRHCLAYDLDPKRTDTKNWDVRNGLPPEAGNCDLVFLDPPYWFLKKDEYSKDSISSLSPDEFLKVMETVAISSYKMLKPGGCVALVMEPLMDESWEYMLDFPVDCINIFREVGFIQRQRISVPLSSQVKSAHTVAVFKKKKELLTLNRDLIIFRKPVIEEAEDNNDNEEGN